MAGVRVPSILLLSPVPTPQRTGISAQAQPQLLPRELYHDYPVYTVCKPAVAPNFAGSVSDRVRGVVVSVLGAGRADYGAESNGGR